MSPQELMDLQTDPPDGVSVSLANPDHMNEWRITIAGPASTPYSTGRFGVVARLPAEYPFKAPTVRFVTRIYHPNISNDSLGNVCLGLIRSENWKPSLRMRTVIEALITLLVEPLPGEALESAIGEEFRSDRARWEEKARESVVKYASGEVVWT